MPCKPMYSFLPETAEPSVFCRVPDAWRTRALPDLGGNVVYPAKNQAIPPQQWGLLFDEYVQSGQGSVVELKIQPPLETPHNADTPNPFCTKVRIALPPSLIAQPLDPREALLHHLFCLFAGSVLTEMSWLDLADVLQWLAEKSALTFAYQDSRHSDDLCDKMRAHLGQREFTETYPVMFGQPASLRLQHLHAMNTQFQSALSYLPAVERGCWLSILLPVCPDSMPHAA